MTVQYAQTPPFFWLGADAVPALFAWLTELKRREEGPRCPDLSDMTNDE